MKALNELYSTHGVVSAVLTNDEVRGGSAPLRPPERAPIKTVPIEREPLLRAPIKRESLLSPGVLQIPNPTVTTLSDARTAQRGDSYLREGD